MAILVSDVKVNGVYETTNEQLRKVTSIKKDSKKRKRVNYVAKSKNFPNRPYGPCHTLANPPLIKTFADAVVKKIN